jgi:hypothetical protein
VWLVVDLFWILSVCEKITIFAIRVRAFGLLYTLPYFPLLAIAVVHVSNTCAFEGRKYQNEDFNACFHGVLH